MYDLSDDEFAQLVADDVRGTANPELAAWLREPDQWLDWRAELELLRKHIQSDIAVDQLSLEEHKPVGMDQPSDEYRLAKREHAVRHRPRLRSLRSLEDRVHEVSGFIRSAGIIDPSAMFGVLIKTMVLLEGGDADAALGVLEGAVEQTAKKLRDVA